MGTVIRMIFLAPFALTACAGASQLNSAIYLHPKAKVDVVSSSGCVVAENMSDDMVVPLLKRKAGEHTVYDESGRPALKVTPC